MGLVAVLLIVLAIAVYIISRQLHRSTGLPAGRLIYSDTGAWQPNERPFFSSHHQLTGKPDYLVQVGKMIVPVEVKSGAAPVQPRWGHILQLAAYCLLVEENLTVRPAYGIIQYADRQFSVDYTRELEQQLLHILSDMQQAARIQTGPHRSHEDAHRCAACGQRQNCTEKLVT